MAEPADAMKYMLIAGFLSLESAKIKLGRNHINPPTKSKKEDKKV